MRWGFLIWELIFIYFCPHLGSFFFVLFLLSLRFGQISTLAFFRWFLPRPRIGMMSLVTVSPVTFHSCCQSHHVFDQVNLWPAWVGFETAIFWQCSPGTVETQRLYPPRKKINSHRKLFETVGLFQCGSYISLRNKNLHSIWCG